MKKLFATVATIGILFAGTAAVNVSAEEYQIQNQDTLWGISNKYDTSVQHLIDINELESTVIYPGQTITTDSTDPTDHNEVYRVEKGDTLNGIAGKYDVKVDEIQDWNNLSGTLINIGQELKIKDVAANEEQNPAKEVASDEASSSNEEEQSEATAGSATEKAPESNASSDAEGDTISVSATAYTAKCEGCTGVTSTGIDLNANPNKKVIAVDPDVIPLGSEVHVEGYGNAIAGDVGGAIKGDTIDVHVPTTGEANSWGVRTVDVTVLD